jgi:outer membrane biogenesis lipoprotein LolB
LLIVALALAACATAPQQPLPQLTHAPQAFEIAGRIAVRDGQRSDIAKLRWTRKPGGFDEWIISSPLGNEVARIDAGPGGATLVAAGSDSALTTSFPAVTERYLGVALDPDMLAGWIHGASTGDAPGGWKVTLDETQRAGAIDIARRITASRGDVVVRFVVDEYRSLE